MTNIDSILKSRDITLLTKIHILNSIFFSPSYVRIWELDHKEGWAPKNWCFWKVVLEKTLESPLDCKEIQSVHLKENQSWIFIGRTGNSNPLATWCKELTPWKWPWFWERLKAGGEWNNREWDGWIASLTQWTWVWVNSGSWWWTGRPSVLQSMGSQRVGHDWATELNWLGKQITDLHFPGVGHGKTTVFVGGHVSLMFCAPWSLASAVFTFEEAVTSSRSDRWASEEQYLLPALLGILRLSLTFSVIAAAPTSCSLVQGECLRVGAFCWCCRARLSVGESPFPFPRVLLDTHICVLSSSPTLGRLELGRGCAGEVYGPLWVPRSQLGDPRGRQH